MKAHTMTARVTLRPAAHGQPALIVESEHHDGDYIGYTIVSGTVAQMLDHIRCENQLIRAMDSAARDIKNVQII